MSCKITLGILVLYLFTAGFGLHGLPHNEVPPVKWVISQNSNLSVNGSTNINKFSCVIPAYNHSDTLFITKNKNNERINLSGTVGLNISSFDCHNSGMTKQLQKTLNEKQFPLLHIRFLSLNKLPVLTARPETITGIVAIEIAGVSKLFEINYQVNRNNQNIIHLIGSRVINFSDFNLVPPQKLGGMIKTKDQLNVGFQMNIRSI